MDAQTLSKRLERKKADRAVLDSHCQEIAERGLPYRADFTVKRAVGEKRTEKIFDSTAALALSQFAAVSTSLICPEGQKWHGLSSTNSELNKNLRVRKYYEEVTRILFRERYRGGFGHQIQEVWTSHGAFGTGGILVEPAKKGGLWYKAQPLSKYWIEENDEGVIDVVWREFTFNARQAYQRFGENIPNCIKEILKETPEKEFEFFQCIMPNEDYNPERLDHLGMPFASYYVCTADKEHILETSGYHTFPMPVSRFMTVAGEPYGYSPFMLILQEQKVLNEMEKTALKVAHLTADPVWLLGDDLMGSPVNFKPGALNHGAINSDGKQMIQKMESGGNLNYTLEMAMQKRDVIKSAFYVNLFQILSEKVERSAQAIIEKTREQGILLAPVFSRQNTEMIGRIVEREIDILSRQGRLPPLPDELVEARGEYEIIYDSPLARSQRSEETAGFARTMQLVTPIAQIDPSVLTMFDFEKTTRGLSELSGMPADWMRTEEEVTALKEQQAQAQQQAQLLEAAPILADAQKKQAEAQAIAQSGPAGRI